MSVFDHPKVKLWAAFVLWGLFCFAVGNGHATRSALDGSARWWQNHAHQEVEMQKRIDRAE